MRSVLHGCMVALLAAACSATSAPPGARQQIVSSVSCSGFALSLVLGLGGQPTPVAAAQWFAAHGGMTEVPRSGWYVSGHDSNGASVRSGSTTLHTVQGGDAKWLVDSGQRC
jgi:hypothetical protein